MPIECIYARLRNNWYINNYKQKKQWIILESDPVGVVFHLVALTLI